MAKQVQFRRGSAADHASFTGAAGEITIDTTNWRAIIHDGVTAGGHPLAKNSALSAYVLATAVSTDGTLAANSDALIPSQKAVKTYVDGAVAGLSIPLTTRGDLMTRDASANIRLAIGAAGKKLVTDGTDPSWGGGIRQIAASTPTGVSVVDFTNIPDHYAFLIAEGYNVSCTSSRYLRGFFSQDNGASFLTSSVRYRDYALLTQAPGIFNYTTSPAASSYVSFFAIIQGYQRGPCAIEYQYAVNATDFTNTQPFFTAFGPPSAGAINAMRFDWSGSGNFDAGTITLYGVG